MTLEANGPAQVRATLHTRPTDPESDPPPDRDRAGDARDVIAALDCVQDAVSAGIELPCQDQDPDLFFAELPDDVERAKAFCAQCPVQALCLAAAVARQEPWGVWGGSWFVAGHAVERKPPRGRPRKDRVASQQVEVSAHRSTSRPGVAA